MSPNEFALPGYEDLEISTQIIIRDAQVRGIEVTVLDRKNNFIKLVKDDHTEYVKQATKTSKDSYVSFLTMENKSVSKIVLADGGLRVPEGQTFDDPKDALKYAESAPWEKMVIKPATTNFGIGIAIAEKSNGPSMMEFGISNAFALSDTILVEEFIEGAEFRFLVIDFETVAICQRIPANVCGDGLSNIKELVAEKNADPRRGIGYRTPLERIELGETELDVLKSDYDFDGNSIPDKDQTVLLRKNSNISTGGDSIDVTDDVHSSYKKIAERAAKLVDASICGVDIILPRPTEEEKYSILELNFNPVLYIHNYPYQGQNRQVGKKILDLLGY